YDPRIPVFPAIFLAIPASIPSENDRSVIVHAANAALHSRAFAARLSQNDDQPRRTSAFNRNARKHHVRTDQAQDPDPPREPGLPPAATARAREGAQPSSRR